MSHRPCTHQCPVCSSSDVSAAGDDDAVAMCRQCGHEATVKDFAGAQIDPRLASHGGQKPSRTDRDFRDHDWDNFDPRADQNRAI